MPGWTSAYAHVVAKAWADDAFKKELLKNPREVLIAHGMEISPNVEVTITPGTGKVRMEFPLPDKPSGVDAAVLASITGVPDICC